MALGEDLYRLIVETRSDLVFVIAPAGTCVYANAAARGLLGLAEDGDVYASVHPDDVEAARLNYGRVVAGEELAFRYRARVRHAWRWLEVWASPIAYASAMHAVAIARDVTEQKRRDQREALQLAVSRVLAEATDIASATSPLLDAVCTSIGCEVGELWVLDGASGSLRCAGQWHSPSVDAAELAEITRSALFEAGFGLPGRVWQCNDLVWITDIGSNPQFLRSRSAALAGLRSAVGCPIAHRDQLLAVLVIMSRDAIEPNRDTQETLAAVSSHVAQFIARQRAESVLHETGRRLRAVVDSAPVIVCTIDRTGMITFAQGRGLAHAGLPDLAGKSVFDVLADYPDNAGAVKRALSGDAFADVQVFNGRTFETVWAPVRSADGTHDGTIAVSLDITDRARAEAAIEAHYRSSLHEKEMLIKEIHHRVKNNLQLVISLLALQSDQLAPIFPGVEHAFTETQLRIQTMALIHETLCRNNNVTHVQLAPHVESICAQVYRSFGAEASRVALDIDIADMSMGLDTALPCGLIINELVANALKHAFPRGRSGTVRVRLKTSATAFELYVGDDGVGLPPGLDPLATETLGLQLIRDLAEQLRATLRIDRERGTSFVFGVPVSRLELS